MEQAQLATDEARLYGSLGQLPEPVSETVLVVVSGLPGTGKSYFSRKLAERLPLVVLESDALRRVLFPSPGYSAGESARLFQAVHNLIDSLLRQGISLVLDATSLSERHREYLYGIADRLGVKLILVRVEAPPQVVRGRLEKRYRDSGSNSDADWAIYQKMRPMVQSIRRQHYAVDTSRDINPVLDKIVREANR